jgi:hypothetical protein
MEKNFLIEKLGSATAVAKALGVGISAVSQWGPTIPHSAVGMVAERRPDILRAWWRHERSLRSCKRNEAQGEANG